MNEVSLVAHKEKLLLMCQNKSLVGGSGYINSFTHIKETLNNLVEFCELTRHQVLGVFFENGYACGMVQQPFTKNNNNGIDAL